MPASITTTVTHIKQLARRHRWALVELTYDAKMQEANRMESLPVINLFQYLKQRAGGALGALAKVQGAISTRSKVALPGGLSVIQQLKWYGKYCPWFYYAAVTDEKELETKALSKKSGQMYRYLLTQFESPKVILELLSWLVLTQRYPRKSLQLTLDHTRKTTA